MQGGTIVVGEQRLAMRGAVQRCEFPGLPGDGDDLPDGNLMVDEEHFDALAHREMRRLTQRGGELLQVVVEERPEHCAPVPPRQPPRGGPEDVILAALRVGQEPALPERVGQPEHAAAVDAERSVSCFSGTGWDEAATASRMARPRSRLWIAGVSRIALPFMAAMC